jgi:hypothetical protein
MFLKIAQQFFSCYGGVAGVSPAEGGSVSPEGWSVGEGFPPSDCYLGGGEILKIHFCPVAVIFDSGCYRNHWAE